MVNMFGIPEKPANTIIEKKKTMNIGNLQQSDLHFPSLASIKSPCSSDIVIPSSMQEQLKYVYDKKRWKNIFQKYNHKEKTYYCKIKRNQ